MARILLISVMSAMLMILLASSISALQVTQQVRAEVVSGVININSPETDMYQENMIPLNISVQTGSLKVKNIKIFENRDLKPLCSRCEQFSGEMFFAEGSHSLKIIAEFDDSSIVEEIINFTVDSKSDIYIIDSGIFRKATARDIADYLFKYNFTLVYKNEPTPEDSCSIRAKNGNASLNNNYFGTNNKLSFYSILSLKQGQGSFSSQMNRKRLSFDFNVKETIENSETIMKLLVINKNGEEASLELNKINKTVDVTSKNISIKNMLVSSIEGCGANKNNFYYLEKNSKQANSIEDVRKTLLENPIFIEKYEGLRYLFDKYWRVHKTLNWW